MAYVEFCLVQLRLRSLLFQAFVQLGEADHGHGQVLVRVWVVENGLLPNERIDACTA